MNRPTLTSPLHRYRARKPSFFCVLMVCSLALLPHVATFASDPSQSSKAQSSKDASAKKDPLLARGQAIYQAQCVRCHGSSGEGVRDLCDRALVGERSVVELTTVIDETMPEDDPSKCSGEDAKAVAKYIHESFYSMIAQARRAPPRLELSRLTVSQYRNSIADLLQAFQGNRTPGKTRGLLGSYYGDKNFRRNKLNLTRIDPTIHFDFGAGSPDLEKFDPKGYSMQWEGSVFAPDTGRYEFVIRSENAIRLWVNDRNQTIIDGWVKSGNDREFTSTLELLGGRYYPIKLDYMKSTEAKGSIELCWRRPGREIETIPPRYLSPDGSNFNFIVTVPFPPDDRSLGYERGAAVSQAWDEATTYAALDVAKYMNSQMNGLSGAKPDASDRHQKVQDFCKRWVTRAFGGALTPEQHALYVERPFAMAGEDPELAVQYCALMTLKSPLFLYPELPSSLSDDLVRARRLALAIWDSIPDNELLQAAAQGKLKTPEQLTAQAERMQRDVRARAKIRSFLYQWTHIDQFADLAKDPKRYPEFTPQLASDLRESMDLFLDEVFWSDNSSFKELMLSESLYLNGSLASVYGATLPRESDFQKVELTQGARAGIISHPLIMTGFAYHGTTSPIHRGVFLSRSVLGRTLRPPPEAVAPLSPDLHADLTTRQRVELQTRPAACQTCHAMINPLGFGLEQFDAMGRIRDEEQGKTIDARGKYFTSTGEKVEFNGARELAVKLVADPEVQQSFVEQMFHHLIHQPIRAYDEQQVNELRDSFVAQGLNMKRLARDCALLAVRAPVPPKPDVSEPQGNQK